MCPSPVTRSPARKAFHVIADALDDADKFMPDDHRHRNGFLRPGVPVVDVNVGAADRVFFIRISTSSPPTSGTGTSSSHRPGSRLPSPAPASFSARREIRRIRKRRKAGKFANGQPGRGARREGASCAVFLHGFRRNGFRISCKRLDLNELAPPRRASAGPWRAGRRIPKARK